MIATTRIMERIRNVFVAIRDWILWIFPHPGPYIPDGTDENERDLQLSLYNYLKRFTDFQLIYPSTFLLLQIMWSFMPYLKDDLSILDWYCSLLCHFYGFFIISFIIMSYVNRQKALICYFLSANVQILLGFANCFDGVWWYYTGDSLRHPSAYELRSHLPAFFIEIFFTTLTYLVFVVRTAFLYNRLRNYRKLRDARIFARELKIRRHLFGG